MLRVVLAFVVGMLILPLIGLLYFRFGYAPVATASSPMPFEKWLAHTALNARIDKEAPKTAPLQASDENYATGVRVYSQNCSVWHGVPNEPASPTAKGMYPRPPQLFGVTDDRVGETYWKVANGIRLTGMPAYTHSLSETEMWQVSLMLANADKLSTQIREKLRPP